MNMFNLNQLIRQNGQPAAENGQYYNQGANPNQNNYQTIMNGLQMLNIQSMKSNEGSSGKLLISPLTIRKK